jgi:hypothetical protein
MPKLAKQIMLSTIAPFPSSRRRGNTGQLIDRIARDLDIELVDLGSRRISAYDYEHLNRNDDFFDEGAGAALCSIPNSALV